MFPGKTGLERGGGGVYLRVGHDQDSSTMAKGKQEAKVLQDFRNTDGRSLTEETGGTGEESEEERIERSERDVNLKTSVCKGKVERKWVTLADQGSREGELNLGRSSKRGKEKLKNKKTPDKNKKVEEKRKRRSMNKEGRKGEVGRKGRREKKK